MGVFFLLTAACGFASLRAAAAAVSVPPLPEMEETPAPGLKLTLESRGVRDVRDVRAARLVALRVEKNSPPSPFLPPGEFKATWEGSIVQRIKGDYSFLAVGRGAIKVTINDEVALDLPAGDLAGTSGPLVKLKKGKNPIKVEYASPKDGDATLRLLWSAKEFIPESVPPTVLTHDSSDKALREQNRLRQGRELFATLRCIKCHVPEDGKLPEGSMPELSADAPSLAGLAARVKYGWLARWINDPHAVRAQAHMPRLFTAANNGEIDQRARDIATYLAPPAPPADPEEGKNIPCEDGDLGARVFVTLGCIACHTPPNAPVDPARNSLSYVAEKYHYGQLKSYLARPEAHYGWTPMPDFRLSDREVHLLAVYLKVSSPVPPADPPTGDAQRGRDLFKSAGCLGCHSGPAGDSNKAAAAPLAKLDPARGCLAPDATRRGNAPVYSLGDDDRTALTALLAAGFASLKQDAPAEFAERQIKQLNCGACHARDKNDDAWSGLSGEVDALLAKLSPQKEAATTEISGDQSRPPLTWVGEKLRPAWMATFIGGELKYKPRPWLAARMPGFPARAKPLADGLAAAHGCPSDPPAPGTANPQLAEIGRKLVGKNGGFSCIQCHGVADQQPLAAFEAPAINFAHVTERLTREYYDRWVYGPQRVLPGTRMPQFADNEGKTALKDIFGGDARKQFDAIWSYLLAGPQILPP